MTNRLDETRGDFVAINDDGLIVDRLTGMVVGRLVEGTPDYLSRSMRRGSQDLINWVTRGVQVIGIKDETRTRSLGQLTARVEEVLSEHGIKFHRTQSEALAVKLMTLSGKLTKLLKVLNCVLDPECDRYGPELRVAVERAFEEVFGPGSIIKAQITLMLRRWLLNDVINVDDVYLRYQELSALARNISKHVYRRSLIKAAIADAIVEKLGIESTEELLRDLGEGQVMELLRKLKGNKP